MVHRAPSSCSLFTPGLAGDQVTRPSLGQESCRELVKLIHDIPLHQVLAMLENMKINLRKLLLEQQGTFKGVATVVFAEDHEQRAGEIDQSLPHGLGGLRAAAGLARLTAL